MKLRQHREDVKFIQEASYFVDGEDIDPLRDIAKRYHRLILMAEEWLAMLDKEALISKRDRRVLKDAGIE